ncbi:MAG: hypothetical protein ABIS21_03220 [Acidimicrobiales bacterium]
MTMDTETEASTATWDEDPHVRFSEVLHEGSTTDKPLLVAAEALTAATDNLLDVVAPVMEKATLAARLAHTTAVSRILQAQLALERARR